MRKITAISIIYLFLGLIWIYASDYILFFREKDMEDLHAFQNYKGFAFVFASTVLLFLIQLVTFRKTLLRKSDEIITSLSGNSLLNDVLNGIPLGLAVFRLDSLEEVITTKNFLKALGWENHKFNDLEELSKSVFTESAQYEKFKLELEQGLKSRNLDHLRWNNLLVNTRENNVRVVKLHLIPLSDFNLVIAVASDMSEAMQNRHQLEMALEVSLIGTWVFDLKNNQALNNNWARMLDYHPNDLSRDLNNFLEILHPDDLPVVRNMLKKVMMGERNEFVIEIRMKSKLGDYRWMQSRGKVTLYDDQNHPVELSGVHIDITSQKKSEKKLKNYSYRHNAAIEGADLGVWDMDIKKGENYVNDRWWEMLGYDSQVQDYSLEVFKSLLHPEDKDLPEKELLRIEKGGKNNVDIILRMLHSDGNYRYIRDRGKVVEFDENGKIQRMIGTHQDITEIKNYEFELEEKEARILNIANNIEGVIYQYMLSADGSDQITFMTKGVEDLFELTVSEAMKDASKIWNQMNKEDLQSTMESVQESARTMKPWSHTTRFITPSGKKKWIHGMGTPRKREDGTIIWDMLALDVTDNFKNQIKVTEYSNRLEKAQEIGKMGYWEFDLKSNEITWSDTIYKVYDRKPELGPPSMQELMDYMSDDDSRLVLSNALQKAIEEGESYDIAYRISTPKGSKFIRAIGYTNKDGNEKITKIHGIAQDITDQKLLERDLIEQKEYFRILTENASDAIIACDAQGRLTFFNETLRKWVGHEDPSLPPSKWPEKYKLYTFDGLRQLDESELTLVRALHGEKINASRFMIKSHDQVRLAEANGSALYNSNGLKIGAMVVIRDITERVEQQTLLNNAFLEGIEQERETLATEIHDSLTQNLGIVSMNINNLLVEKSELAAEKRIRKALEYLDISIDQSRNIAHTLMPKTLNDFGLVGAVSELVDIHREIEDFNIELLYNEDLRAGADIELHLFRVIQESIRNVRKHAEAKNCTINLTFGKEKITLTIMDDGIGFDTSLDTVADDVGIGIRTMENRIIKLNGQFQVESDRGGTSVFIEVPLKDQNG